MADSQSRSTEARRVSLGWVVPALSALVLTAAVGTFGVMTYRLARKSALEAASARLATVAAAFAQPVQPGPAWVRVARSIAASQSVLTIVRTGGRQHDPSLSRQFGELLADTAQSLAVDVRAPDGTVLFSVATPRADSISSLGASSPDRVLSREVLVGDARLRRPDSLRLVRAYPDSASSSELYLRGGHVLLERAVPIHDSAAVIGHLVEVRKLSLTPTGRQQLLRLVGPHAALIIGNVDGSLWFDLNTATPHAGHLNVAPEYTRDGRRWLSATTVLPTGPWELSVEFPVDEVLAPVRLLGRRLFAIGVFVILLGVIVSERLSRKLTVPLTRLTVAAETIAAGDRVTRGFELTRNDEIGRLSRAFTAMADSVRESHDTLEQAVRSRTGELSVALGQLRETQDELLRKERLAAIGQLSSSIAHELRNPLGVMTNSVYYLDSVLHEAPSKVRHHLGKLRAQVQLSESIIRGLLDSTRPPTVVPSDFDVPVLIEEQLGRIEIPASVRIQRAISTCLPPVRADRVQIGQVLMNLFTNAVQAMDEGGDGEVLTIQVSQDKNRVRIVVADKGPGVPREHREKIFEPLFTTKARGIGLGLSVSRALTQVNGGTLVVDDNPGGGARFTLALPAAIESPLAPLGGKHEPQSASNAI